MVHVQWDTSAARALPAPEPNWGWKIWPLSESDLARILDRERPLTVDSFQSIMHDLAARDLYFPDEVVSNYLLALQAKRFAILTGISGTGKTRLAMSVARHFRPVIETGQPKVVPEDAAEVEVKPYMLKYNRIVLPVALLAQLELPAPDRESGAVSINVHYGGSTLPLRIGDLGTERAKALLFKAEAREWFTRTFQIGDRLLLRPHTIDGAGDELEIIKPETVIRRTILRNHRVIPVRPDWTDNRGLLGYYNPITERYVTTEFLRLLLEAQAEEARAAAEERAPHPFFAILDEMNLARVEHYFSDFLSALESGEEIELHHDARLEAGENPDEIAVPRSLHIPSNIYFTGTVNVDETTHMFSPKVLDRAFTLEFNHVDLEGIGSQPDKPIDEGALRLTRLPQTLAKSDRPSSRDWIAFGELEEGDLRQAVIELHELLAEESRHFGYRVANEIARYVLLASKQTEGTAEQLWAALDLAILQKVLPKLHGTQQELEDALDRLLAFAVERTRHWEPASLQELTTGWTVEAGLLTRTPERQEDGDPWLPRTGAKVWRMLQRVRQQGFTAFVE